jgi:hypothetical protein
MSDPTPRDLNWDRSLTGLGTFDDEYVTVGALIQVLERATNIALWQR